MSAADKLGIQLYIVIRSPANCQAILEQRKSQFLPFNTSHEKTSDTLATLGLGFIETLRHLVVNFLDNIFYLINGMDGLISMSYLTQQCGDRAILVIQFAL